MYKRIFKNMGMYFGALIIILFIAVILFVTLSPQMGGSTSKEDRANYAKSKQYHNGVFNNIGDVRMKLGAGDTFKALRGYFGPQPNSKPLHTIDILEVDSTHLANYIGPTRLIWFGHSAFLIQIEEKNILLDPMFGEVPAPLPFLGSKRFSETLSITVAKLPYIDAVLLSHDHYDHLDYGSIVQLKEKVGMFFTPLGVGVHLEAWGVGKERIVELDWWDDATFDGLTFRCAPAQHFSGRGLTDRGKTLWSSWIIQSDYENIFFSGDSGYGPHFKEIGEKYGPFDFAMMECGQYNELWPEIHMMPEETAQAGIDVKAKVIMPIHWGAFKLAMHPWTEPVERLSKKAAALNIPIQAPRIGEPLVLGTQSIMVTPWWRTFN